MPTTVPAPALRPFRYLRQALPWLLALATATCAQDQGGPSGGGVGYFSFKPRFALAGGASLQQFGIVADSVHIHLTRPVNQVVLDTAVFFPADSGALHLALPIHLAQSPETLTAVITVTAGPTVLFRDSVSAEVKDGPPGSTPPPTVTFTYVGPGTNIATLQVVPGDTTIVLKDTLFFTALAFDSSAVPVASFYVGWKTTDTTVAKINANGRLIAPATRGSVGVVGMTPTGIVDTTIVTFAPVPVIITPDSGAGQAGIVGDSLTALFVARVKGGDSLGIPGIQVRFAATTPGGTVRDTLVVTDAQGRARTRGLFGTTVGSYSYTATALGAALAPATFTATASAALPTAIAIQSGNAQTDTTGKLLPLPLVARVTDAFTNPVPGATVVFTRTAGTGTLAKDTVLTDAAGLASVGYTLGATVGTDTITAHLVGTSATVTFTAQGVSNLPTQIIQGLGGSQTTAAGTPFIDSLTVQVLDNSDNPVAGVKVHWTLVSGAAVLSADSTVSDAAGHTGIALTAGTVAGPAQVNASVVGIASPVSFGETITPAAPAALTLVSGNGQSGNATVALPLPLVVHVADAFGNAVPGVVVAFTPSAGGGTVDSVTATTNATGNASSGTWTLGAVAGTDSVTATTAAIPAASVVFTAVGTPSGTTKLWTGAVSNAWSTAGNWNPAGVPTAADNVFIPAGVTAPLIGAASSTNDLTVASGATINTGSFTLTASGNVDIAGSIQGSGTLAANGTGKTLRGTILLSTLNTTGTLTLNGPTQVNSAYTLSGGSLTVGGQTLTLNNGLTVNGSGLLVMTNAADSVDVFGNATFSTSTSSVGSLTNGVIVYHGNFTQTAGAFTNYSASPGHRTRFFAFTLQTINFANPSPANSHFGSVEFANGVGEILATNIAATGTVLVTGGNVNGSSQTVFLTGDLISPPANWFIGTTEWSAAPTQYPDSILGSLNVLAPWTLSHALEVGGNLTINTGGTLTVGGQALRVVGALNVPGSGQLVMTNAADSVDVGGATTFSTGTSGTGLLSAGVLVLRGNFTQTAGAFTNFAPSGTHRTRFLGTLGQTISFSSPGSANSRFQDLEFGDPAGVSLATNVTAMGTTAVSAGTVTGVGRTINLGGDLLATYPAWQVSTTLWGAAPSVYPDSLPRNVIVFNAFTLNKPFKVDSSLSINSTGVLTLNGHSLRVGTTLTQGGVLRMQNTADTLTVGGLMTVNTSVSGVGDLTGGILRLHGGLNQTAGSFSNFQPSGTFVTRFEPSGGQTASFSSPAAANSRFQFLELADSVNFATGIYVAGDVTLLTGGKAQSTNTATLAGGLTDPTDLGWRFATTQVANPVTVLPDSMVTNLVIQSTWSLARRTTLTGNLSLNGSLDLAGDTLHVSGTVTQSGTLLSTSPASLLDVTGAFTVNSGTSGVGSLTDGHLVLHNGFTQSAGSFSNFAPTANFLVTFAGTGGHVVSFSSPGAANSRFQQLQVFDSLSLASAMTVVGTTTLAPAGRIVSAQTGTLLGDLVDPSRLGWRMASTIVPGGKILPDTMTTNLTLTGGDTLPGNFTLFGNVTLNAGALLNTGGRRFYVSGNFTQSGRLQMKTLADTAEVGGTFAVNSSASGVGDLTDGRLLLHGAFTQTAGAFDNFAPTIAQVTSFIGTGGHALSFTSGSAANSRFLDLVVSDSLTVAGNFAVLSHVTLTPTGRLVGPGQANLTGSLVDSSLAGWRMATTQLDGAVFALPSALVTNLVVNDSLALAQATTVTGNVTIQSGAELAMAGFPLRVSGNLTQSGSLRMTTPADSLDVGGGFTVNTSLDQTGRLTDGVMVLHGDFTQTAGSFTNFVPTAPHRVKFTGPAARSLGFTSSPQSHFAGLEIDSAGTITLQGPIQATGTLKVASSPAATLTAAAPYLIKVGGLAVDGLVLDKVTLAMSSAVNAGAFDNVTFTNQDPTKTQLALELPGLAGDTLKFHNVSFWGTPTTGRFVFVSDSVANGATATVGFYNSSPLNGAQYTATDGSQGDPVSVDWSHLIWQVEPVSGTQLVPFSPPPRVAAVDPSGNVIPTFTGAVTISFFTDPTSGAAALAHNVVNAVAGVATFDSLTVSLSATGYQFQATSPGLGTSAPSSLFAMLVPLPPGTTTAFTNGGGDGNWDNPANWTAGIPDSLDNIFVYPNLTATVNSPSRANRVTIGTGGAILLNNTLAVDSSIAAGNTISGGGTLIAQGSGTLSGQMGELLITGTYSVPLTDTLTATSIDVEGSGLLDAGLGDIHSTGVLFTGQSGHLNVANPSSKVTVDGNIQFGGAASTLTAGTLVAGGNYTVTVPGAVTVAPAFTTHFRGKGHQQLVTLATADSLAGLGSVVVTGDSVTFATSAWVTGTLTLDSGITTIADTLFAIQGVGGAPGATLRGKAIWLVGALSYPGTYGVATTIFAGNGSTIPALAAPYDTLEVLANVALGATVNAGTVRLPGIGELDLNAHRMNVTGDFSYAGLATFKMADPKDSLFVGGNFTAGGGSTNGKLTAGLLQIAGNFAQTAGGGTDNFKGAPGHVTRFTGGSGTRTIAFATPVDPSNPFFLNGSAFGDLDLLNGSDSLTSVVTTMGAATIDTATVGGQTLAVNGALDVLPTAPGLFVSSLYTGGGLNYQPAPATYHPFETFFFGGASIPVLPYQWLRVGIATIPMAGDLHVSQVTIGGQGEGSSDSYGGELLMNGHALTTTGNFTLAGFGQFAMTAATDSLDVGGNFTAAGGDMNGRLTDGVIVARSNVYLQPNWVDTTFRASGAHRFRMAAAGPAVLQIAQGAGDPIRFARLTVDPGTSVTFDQFASGTLVATDTFAVHGFFIQGSPARKVIALGDLYVGTSVGLTVDTVELHQGLDLDLSTFSTQLVRYAGVGQLIDSTVGYHDLEVTGTASLRGLTTVGHDLRVRGTGTLTAAGHRVNVADSLLVADSGLLVMTTPADTVDVGVTASFDGRDSDGWLTAGVLRFNYFVQHATTSPNAFRAKGTHHAVLLEANPLDNTDFITFATPGINASRFQEFTIDGGGTGFTYLTGGTIVVADSFTIPAGGSGGVFATSTTMKVGGPMVVQTGTIPIQFDTLELNGNVQVPSSVLGSNVTRFAGVGQQIPDTQNYNRLEVTGTASLETGGGQVAASDVAIYGNGALSLGPNMTVISTGPFATAGNGTVALTDPTAVLRVFGTATFDGGSTAGKLTTGTLELFGGLAQGNSTSAQSFNPSGTFKTLFDGDRHHTLSLATPNLSGGANFQDLEVTANDTLDLSGSSLFALGRTELHTQAALINAIGTPTTDFIGPFIADTQALIQVPVLGVRDTLRVDFSATYSVGQTVFGYYTLPVPSLPYQQMIFDGGTPMLGGPITATGAVTVNGQGSTADLRFNGWRLTADLFETMAGGTITMDQTGDSLVTVNDAYFAGGSETGHLTAGLISVGRDFTQDTSSLASPSNFAPSGTGVEFGLSNAHVVHFTAPDSSWLPDVNSSGAATLSLQLVGRTHIKGGLAGYGLNLTGDTLVVDSTVSGGPAGAFAQLTMLRTGQIYGGTSFSTYAVGTTQFTAPGQLLSLPYDTLVVSDTLRGSYSQVVSANRLIVTGPGSPRHAGPHPGWLYLQGGDGNTTIDVSGDATVEGAGAAIFSNFGTLSTTGDLLVQSGGLLVATASGCCGQSLFDIGGSATFDGASTKDSLVKGLLRIHKDFVQGGPDPESFAADSGFITQFMGGGTHQVSFLNPGVVGSGLSHFGELQSDGLNPSELALHNSIFLSGRVISIAASLEFSNVAGAPIELNTAKLDLSHVTFNDVTLHWTDPSGAPLGEFQLDSTSFINFQPTEDQFVVEGSATLLQPAQANDITFSPLAAGGTDPGHYVRVIDTDSPISTTPNLQVSTPNSGDPAVYFQIVNGAFLSILPFP